MQTMSVSQTQNASLSQQLCSSQLSPLKAVTGLPNNKFCHSVQFVGASPCVDVPHFGFASDTAA